MAFALSLPELPEADGADGAGGRVPRFLAPALVLACYLIGAVVLTWHLWADPASATVAGNPWDADLFAWFFRYSATAVAHGGLPALVTTAMNAPQGVNLMWNTSMLLPGIALAPVTLLAGPQVSLTIMLTLGFAGSAASLFFVLRRWGVSLGAAAIGGAVYGFSPAMLHVAIGHFHLQFAVLPPLIIDALLRLCTGRGSPIRTGAWLGLLVAAQLFIGEELLVETAIAAVPVIVVMVAARPGAVAGRIRPAAGGLAVAAGVTLAIAGRALWAQFFGPLTQHGNPFSFLGDYYKNDLASFVNPPASQLLHTSGTAFAAASYHGGAPEDLAYLGWPLIVVAVAAAVACWRHLGVRVSAVTLIVLEVLSLGAHPILSGTNHPGITLPWGWLANLPVITAMLPGRLTILADGAAGALLAFTIDLAWARFGRRRLAAAAIMVATVLAVAPLLPVPLPAAPAAALPAGWAGALSELRLAPDARVLFVPVPNNAVTDALRWQAQTGARVSMVGGYFVGPAADGHGYLEGNGLGVLADYLDALWQGTAGKQAPSAAQVRATLAYWRLDAVIAVPDSNKVMHYLSQILGSPTVTDSSVVAWRMSPAQPR